MNEQSARISQINRSVAEMDNATQQNAALVEQSTAASATLNEQAHGLSRIVGLFRLHRADARAQNTPAAAPLDAAGVASLPWKREEKQRICQVLAQEGAKIKSACKHR